MATTQPLQRQRVFILAALLGMALAAWAVLVWQAGDMDDDGMGLTMGMDAALFIAIWVVMMVAMMFPTAAPMILAFDRVQAGKRSQGQSFVPTWLFVLAYLAVWSAFGVAAYAIARLAERAADESTWLMDNAAQIGGVVLVVAGLYQLSPLKTACLSKCRTPMSFIMTSWRDGASGALRMGLEHATYCLGCCWLLFVVLFPLGIMNVAVMAAVTALIFAEKSLVVGSALARVAAVLLVAYGALVIVMPDALPTSM